MRNAFEILGATPLDDSEKLMELFEDKQLLLDNDKELASAYAELTNPKKRIKHEVEYLAKNEFEAFQELFDEKVQAGDKRQVDDICTAIIDMGLWFDESTDDIFEQINDNREISGFPTLSSDDAIVAAVHELKSQCINSVVKYLDSFGEKGLVTVYNALVKKEDFSSFFGDELIAHYEIKITNSLQKKQELCSNKFDEIERLCNLFNNGGSLSYELNGKVDEFKKVINEWDKFAQPLQVNAQMRGAQHDDSAALVHDIRNRVIDLCNRSQESITNLLEQLNKTSSYGSQYDALMRQKGVLELPQKLSDGVKFTDIIIKLINILLNTFAEVEQTAEQLKKDKKEITALRTNLANLSSQIEEAKRTAAASHRYQQRSGGCYIATAVYGSYDCPQVWTLRRYRDDVLKGNIFGRAFIKVYYFLSPKFIKTKFFGRTMQKIAKWFLDRKVRKLNTKGFEDTPYDD